MKITIKAKIPEKDFMEGLLNMKYSGCNVEPLIMLYALAHSWHIDKFTYYFNLIKYKERSAK